MTPPSTPGGGFRSLAADLRGRSVDELADLLLARPDLARHSVEDLSALAAAATTTTSTTRALDSLDRPTLQVLEAALVLAPTGADEVARAVDAPLREVTSRLDRLWTAALLWRSPEGLRPVRILSELLPSPAGLAPASEAGTPGAAPAATGPSLEGQLATVSDAGSALLRALTWGPGVGTVTASAPAATQEARRELVAAGLLVDRSATTVQLPREVALALRQGRTHRSLDVEPPAPETGAARRDAPLVDAAAAETSGLLSLTDELLLTLEAHPPAVLANGGLGVREVTAVERRLGIDAPAAHLLLTVAHAAGLVEVGAWPGASDGHRWGPTPAADRWQQLPDPERAAQLLDAWWSTPLDPDATGTTAPPGRRAGARTGPAAEAGSGRSKRVNALSEAASSPTARRRRQELLSELAALGEVSGTVEELLARWAWRHPLRRPPAPEAVAGVLEQARLLGLTATPITQRDRWVASPWLVALAERPEELAATLAEHLPEATSSMLVQADLTAVVPGRPTPQLTRLLHTTTDVESRGGATTHRFSERSLRRALDAGHPASEVRERVAAASATGLPQPVEFLLREVAAGHGRVHVGDARAVLVVDDPALATRMVHDPQLSPLGLEQVAPTVVTSRLPAAQARAFLRDHGYGPSVGEGAAGVPARVTPRTAPPVASRPLTREVALDRVRSLTEATAPEEGDGLGRAAAPTAPRMQSRDPMVVLALLREAAQDGAPVWIWHTDDLGAVRTTLVTPTSVDGGRLYAVKDAEKLTRTWSIHRIVGAAAGV